MQLFNKILPASELSRLDELVRRQRLRATIRLYVSKQVICEAVEAVFSQGFVTASDIAKNAKSVEFVSRNSWLITFLNELPNQYESASKAIDALKVQYPEWLGDDFTSSKMRRSTALLLAIIGFLGDVRSEPEHFPQTYNYLRVLQKKTR